ncbi:helix-turn-helix domain-containing protein, partial [Streptomyces microflavus]|uniref:helix-turn-helix domain-containing protein n=1 Tax=Streptomyces microflavus TaxID=1919 RepID=UPI003F4BC471
FCGRGGPGGGGGPDPHLVGPPRRPAVQEWASRQLAPMTGPAGLAAEETLRAWLGCEGRLGPTAAELGISVPGARKRLTRLETVLRRSLLRPPSARYDLWLALRAQEVKL